MERNPLVEGGGRASRLTADGPGRRSAAGSDCRLDLLKAGACVVSAVAAVPTDCQSPWPDPTSRLSPYAEEPLEFSLDAAPACLSKNTAASAPSEAPGTSSPVPSLVMPCSCKISAALESRGSRRHREGKRRRKGRCSYGVCQAHSVDSGW